MDRTRKRDGRTDGLTDGRTVRLLYASQSSFGGMKISFSFKLFSSHFYGQSFIKTVRGPLGVVCKLIVAFLPENIGVSEVSVVVGCPFLFIGALLSITKVVLS